MIYPLKELLRFVRERSPFYRDLYAHCPADAELRDLPILNQAEFWQANKLRDSRVLTSPPEHGVIYKSGGTTGVPKFSIFTRDEWKTFTEAFGWGMNQGGLKGKERVANLFYSGELYASFLFITSSIENAPEPAINLPISGATAPEETIKILRELDADVLAGVPTSFMALAEAVLQSGQPLPSVRKILFGGESLYGDQRQILKSSFPGVEIRSIGYASVDAGLLGYADLTCDPGEHRSFSRETILELIDETTGEVIDEMDRPGKLVITNLTRALMPILRYPVGDRAVWTEPTTAPNRKFRLLGRSEEGARVGPATLYYEDIEQILQPFAHEIALQGFQLMLEHEGCKDRLILQTAVANMEAAISKQSLILNELLRARPMLDDLAKEGKIEVPELRWIGAKDLLTNARTGKIRRVIDRRLTAPHAK